MTKIILFRHGQKQKIDSIYAEDKKSVGLKNLGIVQINKLGKYLATKFPSLESSSIIYSSHFTRAIQSAEIVKSILKIKEIIVIPEFCEFIASDNYKTSKNIRKHLQVMAIKNPDWISPVIKTSLNSVISKYINKIKDICQENPSDLILISTHGGIIRNTVYSINPELRPSDELIADAKIHEGGYTVLNFDGKNFTVDEFDVHDYLLLP